MQTSKADVMEQYVAEDVRWWFPQSALGHLPARHPQAARWSRMTDRCVNGRTAVLAIQGHPEISFKQIAFTFEHVLEDGDMVMVHATARGVTLDDNDYENEYVFLFRMSGDSIAEGWELLDTAYAYALTARS
jgi:ketosteroid isomerase-like protein